MNRYPRWKNSLIIFIILLCVLYAVPNLFGESPAIQINANSNTAIGVSLLKQVETSLKKNSLHYVGVQLDKQSIKIRFKDTDTQIKAKDAVQRDLGSEYTVALNLQSQSPDWLYSLGAKPMYLGLDLRGGVYFLMQVDMKTGLNKLFDRLISDAKSTLRKHRILYADVSQREQKVEIRFNTVAELNRALPLLEAEFPTFKFTSLAQDTLLVATLTPAVEKEAQALTLKQNIQTLHNRINELGVAEPIIQQQGLDRVVVQLPGVQDTAKAKEILGRTAILQIKLVDEEKSDNATLENAAQGLVPHGDEVYKDRQGRVILVKKNTVLTGEAITDAGPGVNNTTGQSVVNVTLDSRGAKIFQQVTKENVGKRMAILLVEKGRIDVVTAPVINEEIGGGRVQITGMANTQEATDMALLLRAGALAAPMDIVEERTVGPSLGRENIARGVHSTLWGFLVIALMMGLYYWLFGLVSVLALAVNLVLLVALLSLLQATLTLPGLAAIALTLGMAIDANVLINERIREELREGNPPQTSINIGYQQAFRTILDSNVTTLIAGLALFMFGTGPIKGFAVVHVLGILTSLFSAVLVSRALVNLCYGYRQKVTHLAIGQVK